MSRIDTSRFGSFLNISTKKLTFFVKLYTSNIIKVIQAQKRVCTIKSKMYQLRQVSRVIIYVGSSNNISITGGVV